MIIDIFKGISVFIGIWLLWTLVMGILFSGIIVALNSMFGSMDWKAIGEYCLSCIIMLSILGFAVTCWFVATNGGNDDYSLKSPMV